jgi:hypothetical protein
VLEREPHSNFFQFLKYQCKRNIELQKHLNGSITYTAPADQNELLTISANIIIRSLTKDIRESGFFTMMMDESPDNSNKEQSTICLR